MVDVLHSHALVTAVDATVDLVQPVGDLGVEVEGVELRDSRMHT